MLKPKSSRLTVVGIAVATLIVVAGGIATASNMGFKLNRQIVLAPTVPGGLLYRNWISMPYNQPYGNAGAFCTMTGLVSTGLVGRASVAQIPTGDTGIPTSVTCGSPAANTLLLIPGAGLQVVQPSGTAAPSSIIIVGSHNPTLAITVPDAGTTTPTGNYWFSVPYHTTAVTINDLCISSGLTSTGLTGRAGITMLTNAQSASTGVPTSVTCGTSAAAAANLELGTFVQIREPGGPKTFIPAHF
jgi:hypothetical protein